MLVCVGDIVALVPLRQATIQARPTWDRTRCLSDVHFTNVALDQALVLASGASAIALCERLAAHRDFALAADAVGGAAALLDLSVDYLRTRRQFGRPLAMFQALKHRCADLKVQVAAAEALLLDSLARFADQPRQAADLGRVAKQLACAVYARVAEEALQLHGGIAMSAEHNCHLYVKRALLNRQLGERRLRSRDRRKRSGRGYERHRPSDGARRWISGVAASNTSGPHHPSPGRRESGGPRGP